MPHPAEPHHVPTMLTILTESYLSSINHLRLLTRVLCLSKQIP
jgi:hypothetical protein